MTDKFVLGQIKRLSSIYPQRIPIGVIADTLKMTTEEATEYIYGLEKKGLLTVQKTQQNPKRFVDDMPVVQTPKPQKIVKKKSTVKKELEIPVPKIVKKEPKIKKETKPKPKQTPDRDNTPIMFIRVLMGLVGFGASTMSCYYTTFWLLEFLPGFLAFLLSFLMILFAVLSVQVTLVLSKMKGHAKTILIPMFGLLWFVVTFFSMGSTVAGQYNVRMQKTQEQIQQFDTVKVDTIQLQLIEDDIATLEQELEARQTDRTTMLKRMETIEDKKEYDELWFRMNMMNGRINEIVKEIRDLRLSYSVEVTNRSSVFTDTELQSLDDFYGWIGGILSVNRNQVQFWSSIFPAIFIDLIAPIGVAVALFLHSAQSRSVSYNRKGEINDQRA